MSKLYFRYGAMNSGKSTALLQAAYNYEERSQHVLIAKPSVDSKGDKSIVSRLGVSRDVDFLITPSQNLREKFASEAESLNRAEDKKIACLLLDEAQFLTPEQVDQCLEIAVLDGVPVLAYGIRTDFKTLSFPGSKRLLEISHSLEELKTICRCGRKAMFNGRLLNGVFIFDGEQVAIDGDQVTYESLCANCYLEKTI
ncbi:thymidine kinase [Candidatus Aquiluna sp. IMCC13023]|jgi:thymidine kinase|uniref:thymidine kinase n=1 Tax=Candidatus Aquiluna sp. IMCC13023 TaxID=1081644 RepID=UPI0002DA9637|nr:thymidine kinase [Candidatus Aquiluna sp. IMCC13023]|tara:strand:+ start:131 stop:724 length:594 start_codon:yes stop_codon:yes gene_type:complete